MRHLHLKHDIPLPSTHFTLFSLSLWGQQKLPQHAAHTCVSFLHSSLFVFLRAKDNLKLYFQSYLPNSLHLWSIFNVIYFAYISTYYIIGQQLFLRGLLKDLQLQFVPIFETHLCKKRIQRTPSCSSQHYHNHQGMVGIQVSNKG